MSRLPSALAVLALVAGTALADDARCYFSPGWHGGYYLTDEDGYARTLDALFRVLDASPMYKASMELEPYTLERMQSGERFDVERHGRDKPVTIGWAGGGPGKFAIETIAEAAHSGKQGVRLRLIDGGYVNYCQTLDARELGGVQLRFSAWIRARSGNAHFYIDAHRFGQAMAASGKVTDPVPTDNQWHHATFDYVAPVGAETIYPQVRVMNGPGEADFDDLSIVKANTGEELLHNGGIEASALPSLKDTARLDLLRKYVRAGRMEMIGGAYTQPIMYMLGQESVAHQFILGQEAVAKAIGQPVRIYAAQEPDWCGQLPQILTQAGITSCVYRTSWQAFGAAPARDEELVSWLGLDGTRIPTSPMPTAMRGGWGLSGPALPLVQKLASLGLAHPYFLDLADFAAEYVPTPGSFSTTGIVGGLANFCRTIPAGAAAGKQVELSAFLRSGQGGAHLYIDAYHGDRNLSGMQSTNVEPDGQWHRVALRYQVPVDADKLYPQTRVFMSAKAARVDVAALKLTIVGTGEVVTDVGDLGGPDLPAGWNAAGFDGATVKSAIVAGDVPEGKGYVRLDVAGAVLNCDIVTPIEYFRAAGQPTGEWADAYAGFEHRYPFGILAGEHLRADREGEDNILALGRADAMGLLKTHPDIPSLWRLLLMGHHHDVWVCAPTGAFGIWSHGYQRYVDVTMACAQEIHDRAIPAIEELVPTLEVPPAKQMTAASIAGNRFQGVSEVRWFAPAGFCRTPGIIDDAGKPVPARLEVVSKHPDGSAKQIRGHILADVPACGWRTYSLQEAGGRHQPDLQQPTAKMEGDRAVLSNGLLRVEAGPDGVQVFRAGQPVLSAPASLAGVFPDGPQISHFGTVSVGASNAYRAVATAKGAVGPVALTLRVSLDPYATSSFLSLNCDFGDGTIVGEGPEELPLVAPWSHEDRKLRWVFPLAMQKPQYLAHGPFELRKPSRPIWPIIGMALAQGDGGGLALYPDRTTSGVFRQDPAEMDVILAYGGKFIYAPGDSQPLIGKHSYRLVVYPYAGTPEQADVAARTCGADEAIVFRPGKTFATPSGSLVAITPSNAAVMTDCERQGTDLIFRLWRPYPGDAQVKLTVTGAKSLSVADLAGHATKPLASGPTATLVLRSEQIVTFRAK